MKCCSRICCSCVIKTISNFLQCLNFVQFTCDVGDVQIKTVADGQKLPPPPPLVLVSLNIQSVNDAASKKDTIIFAGVAVHKNFTLETPPTGIYHDFFCCK